MSDKIDYDNVVNFLRQHRFGRLNWFASHDHSRDGYEAAMSLLEKKENDNG